MTAAQAAVFFGYPRPTHKMTAGLMAQSRRSMGISPGNSSQDAFLPLESDPTVAGMLLNAPGGSALQISGAAERCPTHRRRFPVVPR